MKKTNIGLLPDGRHVATVCDDALLHIRARLETSGLVRELIDAELGGRPRAQPRSVAKGYVPFGSGQRGVPNSLNAYNTKPRRDDKRSERA